MRRRVALLIFISLGLTVGLPGCSPVNERSDLRGKIPQEPVAFPGTEPFRFDPAQILTGDTVAGPTVSSVDVVRSELDSVYVGSVRFAGEITVSGTYRALYDDPEPSLICLHVDADSAGRIPRMLHDERSAWFCFENQEEVERPLETPGTAGTATVVVADYRTVYQFTDAFDTARLVRVIERSDTRME